MRAMKKTIGFMLIFCLVLMCCTAVCAEAVSRMHYVYHDWVGEYTGQVDTNNIPFGFGVFVSSTPREGESWHYMGNWEAGVPEGEGAIYFENGNMLKGIFSNGEMTEGLAYSVTGLSAVQVKTERALPESNEAMYIGNKRSLRFHYPTCRSVTQMSEKNRIEFFSREEAIERGYKPCGDCNP